MLRPFALLALTVAIRWPTVEPGLVSFQSPSFPRRIRWNVADIVIDYFFLSMLLATILFHNQNWQDNHETSHNGHKKCAYPRLLIIFWNACSFCVSFRFHCINCLLYKVDAGIWTHFTESIQTFLIALTYVSSFFLTKTYLIWKTWVKRTTITFTVWVLGARLHA